MTFDNRSGRCIICGKRVEYHGKFCKECSKKWL